MNEINYNELFEPGNLVVLKNNKTGLLWYHQCLTEEQMEQMDESEDPYIEFDRYYIRPTLDSPDHNFTIEYVYRPTSDFSFEKIFDRSVDFSEPKPELKTGTFVRVAEYDGYNFDEEDLGLGVIVNDLVIYQNGDFDYLEDLEPLCDEPEKYNFYIVAVYDDWTNRFLNCTKNHLMWHMRGYKHG